EQAAQWYDFEVRSADGFGNVSDGVAGRFFTPAAPDENPPRIEAGSLRAHSATEDGIWIEWRTNERSDSRVEYALEGAAAKRAGVLEVLEVLEVLDVLEMLEVVDPTLTREHSVHLSGLTADQAYRFVASSRDAWGHVSVGAEGRFRTAAVADRVAPVFTGGPGVQPPDVESVEVVFTTDEATTAEVYYGVQGSAEAQQQVAASSQLRNEHTLALLGLTAGTEYAYRVRITDGSGNQRTSSLLGVRTRQAPDVDPPQVEGFAVVAQALRAVLDLRTNEPVGLSVSWWPAADPTAVAFTERSAPAAVHAVTMDHLQAATAYGYELRIADEAGNGLAPIEGTFRTEAEPDQVAPTVLNAFVDDQRLESTVLALELSERSRVQAQQRRLEVSDSDGAESNGAN
ncbi:MAG: fibronectin type III domain-containing protein, partial [Candidatus Latescibacteria bacterium]|nr:fibronectin type III domain-containing protein [Candidatus Latescibacterota bacterium]